MKQFCDIEEERVSNIYVEAIINRILGSDYKTLESIILDSPLNTFETNLIIKKLLEMKLFN